MSKTEEAQSKVTISHEEIKTWADNRGGIPMRVKDPEDAFGGLRISFEEDDEQDDMPLEDAEAIEWAEFFKQFEESNLAFQYQEKTLAGKPSKFFRFVDRDVAELSNGEEEEDEDEEETDKDGKDEVDEADALGLE